MKILLLGNASKKKVKLMKMVGDYLSVPVISLKSILQAKRKSENIIPNNGIVDNDQIIQFIKNVEKSNQCANGFILNYTPVTLLQARTISKELFHFDLVIRLNLDDELEENNSLKKENKYGLMTMKRYGVLINQLSNYYVSRLLTLNLGSDSLAMVEKNFIESLKSLSLERSKNELVNWLTVDINIPENNELPYNLDAIEKTLQPGDVILVEGCSRISLFIQASTQSVWSHAMLYIGKGSNLRSKELKNIVKRHYTGNLNHHLVIEAILGQGVIVTELSNYSHCQLRICRPTMITLSNKNKVIHHCIKKLGHPYGMQSIKNFLSCLITTNQNSNPVRLTKNDFSDSEELNVCSVLLAQAFFSAGYPVLVTRNSEKTIKRQKLIYQDPRLITPKDFDLSPYFKIIGPYAGSMSEL